MNWLFWLPLRVFRLGRAWVRYLDSREEAKRIKADLERLEEKARKRRRAEWDRKVKDWPSNDANSPDERRAVS